MADRATAYGVTGEKKKFVNVFEENMRREAEELAAREAGRKKPTRAPLQVPQMQQAPVVDHAAEAEAARMEQDRIAAEAEAQR